MTLTELKAYLRITTDENDAFLSLMLESAIDYVCQYTNNPFLNADGERELPAGVKLGVAKLLNESLFSAVYTAGGSVGGGENIKQEKVDGLTVTYFTAAEMAEAAEAGGKDSIAMQYFRPYVRLRMI